MIPKVKTIKMNDMKELYYKLYDEFSEILLKNNPCEWKENKCIHNRENNSEDGCCQGCTYNTAVGCNIQSLACKVFLCERAFSNLSQENKAKWRSLVEEMDTKLPGLQHKMTVLEYLKPEKHENN
jgi:hypothetical protein